MDLEDGLDGWNGGLSSRRNGGILYRLIFLTLQVHEVRNRIGAAHARRQWLATEARRFHEEYWSRTFPEKKFERAFYSEGWDVGFSDEMKFFSMRAEDALGENAAGEGNDKIRCLEICVEKWLLESYREESLYGSGIRFPKRIGAFMNA